MSSPNHLSIPKPNPITGVSRCSPHLTKQQHHKLFKPSLNRLNPPLQHVPWGRFKEGSGVWLPPSPQPAPGAGLGRVQDPAGCWSRAEEQSTGQARAAQHHKPSCPSAKDLKIIPGRGRGHSCSKAQSSHQ